MPLPNSTTLFPLIKASPFLLRKSTSTNVESQTLPPIPSSPGLSSTYTVTSPTRLSRIQLAHVLSPIFMMVLFLISSPLQSELMLWFTFSSNLESSDLLETVLFVQYVTRKGSEIIGTIEAPEGSEELR